MTTTFYLHDVTQVISGIAPSVKNSTQTSSVTETTATANRAMDASPGVLQVSAAITSAAVTTTQFDWMRRFCSWPITTAATYGAGTWTLAVAGAESNASANLAFSACVYIWRTSTGALVGRMFDVASPGAVGPEPGVVSTEAAMSGTFTGSGVAASAGDIVVCEIWVVATQGATMGYTDTLYYDGTTSGSATSNAAHLTAPADIPVLTPAAGAGTLAGQGVISGAGSFAEAPSVVPFFTAPSMAVTRAATW